MSAAKGDQRCSRCGYYLPIDMNQSKTVESCLDCERWPTKVVHEITLTVRRAMMKCGVCGRRCEVVAGTDRRGCEFWWRDE